LHYDYDYDYDYDYNARRLRAPFRCNNQNTHKQLKTHPALLAPGSNATARAAAAPYLLGTPSLAVPKRANRRIIFRVTQPLLEINGLVRW
jgi:hypothetical protein